jgi:hypothetical protein
MRPQWLSPSPYRIPSFTSTSSTSLPLPLPLPPQFPSTSILLIPPSHVQITIPPFPCCLPHSGLPPSLPEFYSRLFSFFPTLTLAIAQPDFFVPPLQSSHSSIPRSSLRTNCSPPFFSFTLTPPPFSPPRSEYSPHFFTVTLPHLDWFSSSLIQLLPPPFVFLPPLDFTLVFHLLIHLDVFPSTSILLIPRPPHIAFPLPPLKVPSHQIRSA